MQRIPVGYLVIQAFSVLALAATESMAQGRAVADGTSFDVAVTPFYQPEVDIDNGGEFTLSSALFRFKVTRALDNQTRIGVSVKYDFDDYDFSGPSDFSRTDPWTDVSRFGIGIPVFFRLDDRWSLGVTPSVDWLKEDGADTGESVSYGVTGFAFKSLDRSRRIGLGAGIFKDIDDDARAFPFLAVDWQFNERWRLANPFDADVLGPAGLELSYKYSNRWRLGAGGVYRSFRFRLNRRAASPGGIGENKGVASFLRLRRRSDSAFQLDFYLGAVVGGELELQDRDGDEIGSADYDTAPFAAVTVKVVL